MVNQRVLVRDKWRWLKRLLIVFLVIAVIVLILVAMFFFGFFSKKGNEIVIENPLKDIVFANTDPATGLVNREAVVEQAIIEFNAEYINYLLIALGVGDLHKSLVGYGNPMIEFSIDEEVWGSELSDGMLNTEKKEIDDEDLRIYISRKEAVEALLSSDIEGFMKNSVYNGNTRIEMVAGKIELGSKGYLSMYKGLTGEEIE